MISASSVPKTSLVSPAHPISILRTHAHSFLPVIRPAALPPAPSSPSPHSPNLRDAPTSNVQTETQAGDQTYATVHSMINDPDEYQSPPRERVAVGRGSGIPRVGMRGRGRGTAGTVGRGRAVSAASGRTGAGSAGVTERKKREVSRGRGRVGSISRRRLDFS